MTSKIWLTGAVYGSQVELVLRCLYEIMIVVGTIKLNLVPPNTLDIMIYVSDLKSVGLAPV